MLHVDLPGGTVDKNQPANVEDIVSISGSGRFYIPRSNQAHTPQLLSLHSRANEPQWLKPGAYAPQQEKLLQWEAHRL